MQHLRTIILTFNNTIWVPLQRPFAGSRLQSNMREHPGLRARHAKGSPETLRELRNSTGKRWELSLLTLSTLIWIDSSPGKISRIDWLIPSTVSFFEERNSMLQEELVRLICLIDIWTNRVNPILRIKVRDIHLDKWWWSTLLYHSEVVTCFEGAGLTCQEGGQDLNNISPGIPP